MGHYKTRKVTITKDGKIRVCIADSNVRPLTYRTLDYPKSLSKFLLSVSEGNFRLYRGANPLIEEASERIEGIRNRLEKNDFLSFSSQIDYGLDSLKEILGRICDREEYLLLRQLGIKVSYVKAPDIDALIKTAEEEYTAKKEELKRQGIKIITCAACSIFKGYDLLRTVDGDWILAPAKYYEPGKLACPEKMIIMVGGKEAENLYPFLSFSGISLTQEGYVERTGKDAGIFDVVDGIVKKVLDIGVILESEPYKGFYEQKTEAA